MQKRISKSQLWQLLIGESIGNFNYLTCKQCTKEITRIDDSFAELRKENINVIRNNYVETKIFPQLIIILLNNLV